VNQSAHPTRGTLAAAVAAAQASILETQPKAVLLGECVGRMGGAWGTSQGLAETFGPNRVMDLPLTEGGMLGYAIGMAMGGARPIVEISGPDRIPALMAQLQLELASMQQRSHGELGLPLILRVPSGASYGRGPYLQSSPAGTLSSIEGLIVASPASPADAASMLLGASQLQQPVVILEPAGLYGAQGAYTLEAGELKGAQRVREGSDVTILAWGGAVVQALSAAETCWQEGFDVEVIDLRVLQPLDLDTIGATLARTGRVVLATDGVCPGSDNLLSQVTQQAFLHLEAPPKTVSLSSPADVDFLIQTALESANY